MLVWRLALGRFHEIDGEGARLYRRSVEQSGLRTGLYSHPCTRSHCSNNSFISNSAELPDTFRAFAIELPDDTPRETVPELMVVSDQEMCRHYGDDWAAL